jgi:hypothetical protein
MELGALSYFTSNLFWFSSFLALLLTFYTGYKTTGPTEGRMKAQINFASDGNKFKLLSTFLVLQVVLNLAVVAGVSVLL